MRLIVLALLTVLMVASSAPPVWAEPAGSITVAAFRDFLAAIEEKYDERAARAVAVFFADAALTQGYLWSDCLRDQTVLELRTWIRESAPPELTLRQALRLNAKEHGCEPRDQADVDAELAIRGAREGRQEADGGDNALPRCHGNPCHGHRCRCYCVGTELHNHSEPVHEGRRDTL